MGTLYISRGVLFIFFTFGFVEDPFKILWFEGSPGGVEGSSDMVGCISM
jgi:hypothetical protein